jgi:hypothetical protein
VKSPRVESDEVSNPRPAPSTGRSLKVGAGAAGAGSGTLLVLLANNLHDGDPWKSWLVILAPSASIAISAIYGWVKTAIDRHAARQELSKVVDRAKVTLREALQNPATSEEHRQVLRKELEALELLLVKADVDKIRVLTKVF